MEYFDFNNFDGNIKCPKCGYVYSYTLKKCPKCDARKKSIFLIKAIIFSLLIIFGFVSYEYFVIDKDNSTKDVNQETLNINTDNQSDNDANGIPIDNEDDSSIFSGLYFNQLSDVQKQIYEDIYYVSLDFSPTYTPEMDKCDIDDVSRAIAALNFEHPEFFWVSNNFHYKTVEDNVVEVDFDDADGLSNNELSNIYDQIMIVVNTINQSAQNFEGIEQIRVIHNYICQNFSYDINVDYSQDVRSMVFYNAGVCSGYTKLFQLCLQNLGYECYEVIGTADNGTESSNHAWDIVIYDGYAYFVDVTWDDDDTYNYVYDTYFMVGNEIYADHTYGYEYDFILLD